MCASTGAQHAACRAFCTIVLSFNIVMQTILITSVVVICECVISGGRGGRGRGGGRGGAGGPRAVKTGAIQDYKGSKVTFGDDSD